MQGDQSFDDLVRQAQRATEDERRQLLDQLVTQFAAAAFRWAVMILEDETAAYDALQDAWLSAYLHLDQLRESVAFPAWFRQIVLTSCYHALRRGRQNVNMPESTTEEAVSDADPIAEVEDKERLEHIREAVLALPEREREVTELFYFADYPQHEIAEVLGIPLTTVKKRLQYAREHLRELIKPETVAQLNGDLLALKGGSTGAPFGELLFPIAIGAAESFVYEIEPQSATYYEPALAYP